MVTFSLNFIVTKSLGLNIFYKRDCILKKIMYNVGNLGTFRRMVMKENSGKQLAKKMLIALICGLNCWIWLYFIERTLKFKWSRRLVAND